MKKIFTLIASCFLIAAFTLLNAQPIITSFSPASGSVGTSVTIAGSNFNTTATSNIVFFGATKATVNTASATSLTVTVPTGATYAPITVLNTSTGLTAYSLGNFTPTFNPIKTAVVVADFTGQVDFTAGANPQGIAIGDLDGDGKPDLAVANGNSATVSVYRNISTSGSIVSSSFASKVDFTTGTGPVSVAIGDLDGDGNPDLAVSNGSSASVSVFRNTSTSGSISSSSFASKVDFTTGTSPFSVTIGDVDGDGKPELTTANFSSNSISVFRNTSTSGSISSGSFAAKVDFTTGNNPYKVAIGDIDGDGKPDLVSSNYSSFSVSVFRNTSISGTISSSSFASKVDFATGGESFSVAIGDIDGDGKSDLVTINVNTGTVSVLRNTSTSGTVGFATKVDFVSGSAPRGLAIGDINGDGKIDLVVGNYTTGTVSIFRNTSTSGSIVASSFATKVDLATGFGTWGVELGDLDGDGLPDIALALYGSLKWSVLRNIAPPSPPSISSFTPVNGLVGSTVTIIGTNFNTTAANNIVFFGATKAIVTAASSTSLTVTVPTSATYAPISVLNNSTNLSAISAGYFTPIFSPAKTTISTGDFATRVDVTGLFAYAIAIGDIDGDGKPDMVTANGGAHTISVYRNISTAGSLTTGSFVAKVDFGQVFNSLAVAIADVDGDGKPDIVAINGNFISVFRNTSTIGTINSGSFATKVDFAAGSKPYSIAIGDLDGDGKKDIASVDRNLNTLSVFRNTSTSGSITAGSFAAKVDYTTGTLPTSVSIADLNGDGKPDLVVANNGAASVSVFQNTASSGSITAASFAAKVDFTVGTQPTAASIGDLDLDGKLDIVVANTGSTSISILKNTSSGGVISSGSFAGKVDFVTAGGPFSSAIGDLDGDGDLDIAVANYSAKSLSLYRNNNTVGSISASSFAAKVDFATTDFTPTVAISDLDGDGKPDLATASSLVNVFKNIDPPTISTSGTTTAFNTCAGTTSATQSFTVSGTFLSANLVLTAPSGYELSLSNGGSFSSSLSLTPVSGTLASTSIFVRLSSSATGTPSGNITLATTGATSQNVAVSGTINPLPVPTISASGPTTICSTGSVNLSAVGGNALQFDGSNDVVDCGTTINTSYINNATSFTVEAWVKMNNVTAESEVVSNSQGGVFSGFELRVAGGNVWFTYRDNNGTQTGSNIMPITTGQWYHIAGVISGTQAIMYVNGVPSSPYTIPGGGIAPATTSLRIGANQSGFRVNGLIDEVRLWNIARTQGQIQAGMNSIVAANSTGLIANYKLDETSGTIASDASGHGFNGILQNGPVWVASTAFGPFSSYVWNPGGLSTQNISVTTAASYNVTVTDINGCTATSAGTTITVTPTVTPTFTQVAAICTGASISALPATSTNGITGTWSPALNNTTTTTYTFTPNVGQCATTATMTITVNANPSVGINPATASICAGSSVGLSTTNGLLGYWKFDEGTGTIAADASGNNLTATFQNGSGWTASSAFAGASNAATFVNGGRYMSVNDNALFNTMQTKFTIEAWIYQTDAVNNTIIDRGDYNFLLMSRPNGQPGLGFYNNGSWIYSTSTLPINTWVHIACTWDGATNTMRFYTNGVLTDAINRGALNFGSGGPVNIGRQSPFTCACNIMDGSIDELRVWNVVKTATELLASKNAALNVSSSGATYTWSPSTGLNTTTGSSVIASPSATTTYTISATANGCTTTSNATVTVNALPVVTANHAGAGCENDQIELYASPGVSHSWTGPNGYTSNQQNPIIANGILANAGVYTVTVTNASGCSASASTTVIVNALPVITAGSNSPVCEGGTLNLSSNGGVSYIWTGPNGFSSNVQNPSIATVVLAATGTYSVKGTGANGCRNDATVVVMANPLPTISGTLISCAGRSRQLTGTGTPAASNPWISSNPLIATVDNTGLVTGVAVNGGSVVITYTNSNGCSITANFTVPPLPPTPTVSVVNNCDGTSTLTASGYTSFQWALVGGPVTNTGVSITVNTPGTYGARSVSSQCVSSFAYGIASPNTTPVATITADGPTTICAGGSVTLTASEGSSYLWSNSATTQSITVNTTDAYSVTVTNASGCSASSTATSVIVNSLPTFTACPANQTANSAAEQCNAVVNYTAIATGSLTPIVTYSFSGATTGSGSGTGSGQAFNVGVTNVTLTATNACGSSTCTFTVTVADVTPPLINGVFNIQTPNVGGVVQANGPYGTNVNFGGLWASDNCQNGLPVNFTANYPNGIAFAIGTYPIIFTATDAAGNISTATHYITVADTQIPSVHVQNVTVYLDASGNASVTAAQVNNGSTDNTTIATYTLNNSNFTCANIGANTVTLTVTDIYGNAASANAIVTVVDNIAPQITCTSNISVNATSAAGAVVTFVGPIGTDNCVVSTSMIAGLASGSTFPIGTTTVTYRATDASGNYTDCSFTVTVSGLAPVVVVPANITVNNTKGLCAAIVNFAATETTGIPASTITYSIASGTSFPVGTTQVTVTATNAVGTSINTFDITVVDNEAPSGGSVTFPAPAVALTNVPEAANYSLVYALDVPNAANWDTHAQVPYSVNNSAALASTPFNRVAYLMDLGTKWVWVSFDKISSNLNEIGIPADYISKQKITNMNVFSSTGSGVTNGTNIATGSVEFWPYCYTQGASNPSIPTGNNGLYDFNDAMNGNNDCYGSFQVHNYGIGQTIFAYNSWSTNNIGDLGIGNQVGGSGHPDWTFANNASTYGTRKIYVFISGGAVALNNPTIQLGANGQATLTVAQVDPGITDNCGVATRVLSKTNFDCTNLGANTVTLTVTDIHGNATTATATVTVVDNIAPVITCPTNINVFATSAAGAVVNYSTPIGTDNCAVTTTMIAGLASGATFPIGVTTVTYKATDASGNTVQCSFTVTVSGLSPVIVVPANISANNTVDKCEAAVSFAATDATGIPASTITYTENGNPVVSGSIFSIGVHTITATATNIIGSSSGTFTITVVDAQAPKVLTQDVTVYLDASGQASVTAAQINNGSTDNCGIASMSVTPNNFTCADLTTGGGAAVMAYTGTINTGVQNYGGTLGMDFDVVIPGGIVISQLGAFDDQQNGINGTQLGGSIRVAIFNRNTQAIVPGLDVYISGTSDPLVNRHRMHSITPITLPVGNYSVVALGYNNSERNGNSGISGYPATATNTNGGAILFTGGARAGSGLFDFPSSVDGGPASRYHAGTFNFSTGTAAKSVVLSVTDTHGNIGTATAKVTVLDNIAPVITCPANQNVIATSASGRAVTYSIPTATDNCSATVSMIAGLASGATFPIGTTTVTYRATDASGNRADCSFTVTVAGLAPVIVVPANITVNNAAGVCGANVSYAATDATGIPASTITYSIAPGSLFAIGTTNVTATATNAVGSSSATFTVTVVDAENPVLSAAPVEVTVECNDVPLAAVLTATDNCSAVVTMTETRTNGINSNNYTLTRVWTATDPSGNAVSKTQVVTVRDITAPSLTVPQNISVNNDENVCGSAQTFVATATDNCSDVTITYSHASGTVFPVGTTTVIVTATDASGNASTGSFTVTVRDNQLPVITTNGNKSVNNDLAKCGAMVVVSATAVDNCGVAVVTGVRSDEQALDALYPVGTTTITWTVTDIHGNAAIPVIQTIVVTDNESPIAIAQARTIYLDATGHASISTTDINNGSNDNCAIDLMTLSKTDFDCSNTGANTVTLTVKDIHGNSSSTTAIVTVVDNINPVLSAAPADVTVECDAVPVAAVLTATDNCSAVVSYTETRTNGSNSNNYTLTRVWTATDPSNNSVSSTQVITVRDTKAPSLSVPANISVNNDVNVCGATVGYEVSATDNCSDVTLSYSHASGTVFPVGTTTVTVTAKDASGNTSIGTFDVTVTDNQLPMITTNGNKSVNNDLGQCGAMVVVSATAVDNCGVGVVTGMRSDEQALDAVYPVGTTTITWTVTDIHGNAAIAAIQTVTVTDAELPIVHTQNITIQLNASGVASITTGQINNGSTDNCGIASYSLSQTSFNCSNVGVNTVTLSVTDIHGNVSTATATVTVQDNVAPIAQAQNITVGLDAVTGQVVITAAQVNNGSSDACGIASMSVFPNSFTCANQGPNTVTLTVTDNNGNVTTTTAVVTVVDNTAPIPTVATLATISGQCSVKLKIVTRLHDDRDGCNDRDRERYHRHTKGKGHDKHDEDGRGKGHAGEDGHDGDDDDDDHDGDADGYTEILAPTAMDNCSGLIVGTTTSVLSYNNQGTYTIRWKFVDAKGNISYQDQTVLVQDTQAPKPQKSSLPTITGQCSVNIAATRDCNDDGEYEGRKNKEGEDDNDHDRGWGNDDHNHWNDHHSGIPWAKDNCAGWIKGTTTDPLVYTTQGTYIIHWTFNDGHGNSSTQNQTVIVADVTKPKLKVPSNKTVVCGSNTLPAVMGMATATDNCSTAVVTYSDVNNGQQIVRTWRATDAAGNYSTATQTISLTKAFDGTAISTPTSNVYTGGENNNLYLGYGAQSTTLSITGLPSSGAPYSYVWSGANSSKLSSTTSAAPVFTPTTGGVSTFTVIVTNKNGCSNTESISICVTDIRVPGTGTSASNPAKVYVCHKGTGKTGGTQTVSLLVSQVAAHIGGNNCGSGGKDRLGSCNQNPCNSGNNYTVTGVREEAEIPVLQVEGKPVPAKMVEELKVTVMPNPSTTYFTIKLESKSQSPVDMHVLDASGRMVESKSKMPTNGSYQIGHNYAGGTYYVELIQDNKRKVVQVIKLRG